MMEPRLADYFITVGLGEKVTPLEAPKEEFDLARASGSPVTEIAVVFSRNEKPPPGYESIETTPKGRSANVNPIGLHKGPIYICYCRGTDKPPILEIGVFYSYKDNAITKGHEAILRSVENKHEANVNTGARFPTYLTFRRSPHFGHQKAITHLAVIHEDEPIPPGYQCLKMNLNKGVGRRVFLCYKSAVVRPPGTCFKPTILSRYPDIDYEDFPLTTEHLPMFCLPVGVSVELWNEHTSFPLPTFSTFVLTSTEAIKMYGATVLFYEPLAHHNKMDEIRQHVITCTQGDGKGQLYVNKCINLFSRWPFFAEFKAFLSTIYRLSLSQEGILPLERYIQTLMDDCPFPTIDRPRVMIDFGIERFYFSLPLQTPLPFVGAVHWSLLVSLDVNNLIQVLTMVLLEQKVVLHSARPALLTAVGEALCSILFPLSWQCSYIPMCPLALATYIEAPVPFIIGIDSRYMMMAEELPDDVTFIDLDANVIKCPPEIRKLLDACKMSKKCTRPLKNVLKPLAVRVSKLDLGSDLAVDLAPPGYRGDSYKADIRQVDVAIREAFIRFNALLLQNYRHYLRPIDSPADDYSKAVNRLFDAEEFIKQHAPLDKAFFQVFTDTQLFCSFVEHRSFTHSEDTAYAFFDECVEKVKLDTSVQLLNTTMDESSEESRTVVAPPPDGIGLQPGKLYTYETFPALNGRYLKPTHRESQAVGEPPVLTVHQRSATEKQKGSETLLRVAEVHEMWAKVLLSQVYTVWFLHLPTLMQRHWNKRAVLDAAYQLMHRMASSGVPSTDQVCYRILMDQYTKHGKPAMAIKVMAELQKSGSHPNAVTYGFYNQAMLESHWPLSKSYWKLYKYVFGACWFLRQSLRKKKKQNSQSLHLSFTDESQKEESLKSPMSPRRAESLGMGIGVPLMARLTTFPMYDPSLELEEDSVSPKTTPQLAKKRTSLLLTTSPMLNKLRRISVYNRTTPTRPTPKPWALNNSSQYLLEMSSCSPCPSCHCLVYDEDIMANWTTSESEYNTCCPYCSQKFVPKLSVRVRKVTSAKRKDGIASSTPTPTPTVENGAPAGVHLHPLTSVHGMKSRGHARSMSVPMADAPQAADGAEVEQSLYNNILLGPEEHVYLSPIVLRKELERHLRQEKEILSEDFMTQSPVLFWNLMWFLSRAGVQSYLLQELANHLSLEKSLMQSIAVDIWWDRLPEKADRCLPMYSKQRQDKEGTLNQIIKGLCAGNVMKSVGHLLSKSNPTEDRTMYRDIALLVCALQGPQFDPEYFDHVFKVEVNRTPREYLSKLLSRDTELPTQRSIHCRQAFWMQSHGFEANSSPP